MFEVLQQFLLVLVVVSIIAAIHELGHYVAARSVGVYCEVVSVGFGKVLFEKIDSRGCCWRLSLLPLGGYVQLYGMHPNYSDNPSAFTYKHPWERIWIMSAGCLFNIISALIVFLLPGLVDALSSGSSELLLASLERVVPIFQHVGSNLYEVITLQVNLEVMLNSVEIYSLTDDEPKVELIDQSAWVMFVSLSIIIAVMNLLPMPFPILDGGYIILTLAEWIRGKPLSRQITGILKAVGFLFLITFWVLINV